jgi:hypothetical protein
MPDKYEQVTEEIANALANNECHVMPERALLMESDKVIIASILRREYGDVGRVPNCPEEAPDA